MELLPTLALGMLWADLPAIVQVEGMGSNKVVLGNRIRNVILGNPDPSVQAWSPWNITKHGEGRHAAGASSSVVVIVVAIVAR